MNKIKEIMSLTGWTKEDWKEAFEDVLAGISLIAMIVFLLIWG